MAVLTLLIIPPMLSVLVGTLEKGSEGEPAELPAQDERLPAPGE